MAFNTFTVAAKLDADARGVSSGVRDAQGSFGKLGGFAKGAGLAVAGGLAIAAGAAVKLGVDAIGAASDLEETRNKSRVIFGKMAADIEKWSQGSARAFGLSQQEALAAAAGFGDMFSQLGQSQKEAANTSKSVVQLAADLGSFNNLETADVTDRISAAFRGEYDSLQALIPNINAARVEKEALAASGKSVASELTAEEKAMAALAIITKDGARAQGDFAKTSGSLSNQQKILGAQFENLKATIGEKLLPVATRLVVWANDNMLPAAKELGAWISKNLGPVMVQLGEFIQGKVIPAAKDFYHWFVEEIVPGIKATVMPILEGLRKAFGIIADKIRENEPELRQLMEGFKVLIEFIWQHVMPLVGSALGLALQGLAVVIGGVIDKVAQMVGWIRSAVDAIQDLIDWIGKIDMPDLNIPGNPFGRVVSSVTGSGGGALPVGGKYERAPIVINVNGAIDRVGTARQIRELLADVDALAGTPLWSGA